jgi:hypothetical protein
VGTRDYAAEHEQQCDTRNRKLRDAPS